MCLIHKLKIRLVNERGGLQGVPLSFAAHIIVRQAMQFGLHERDQFLQRSFVSAALLAEQLSDLLSRGWGRRHRSCSTPQTLTRSGDFYSTARGGQKKSAQSWRVSGGLSALPHQPAQTKTRRKTKTETKPQKRNERKLSNASTLNITQHASP